MKTKLIFPMLVVVFAAGCGRDGVARADQKNYEVVQEGSASGVTSTLQGPGEALPPITGTNADTTTAFTIDPNAVAGAPGAPPPTMAGTMPYPSSTPPPSAGSPPPMQPRSRPVTTSQPQPSQGRQPEPRTDPRTPPENEPAPAPPPMTDTASAQPAPPAEPQEQEPVEEEEEEEEEVPPPTTTDTRGH